MFRRKDTEPGRPAVGEKAPESPLSRPTSESKPMQTELPRRTVDIPTGPLAPPAASVEAARSQSAAQAGEGKRLIVGQGISLSGEITACDRLVVEGSVQVTLNETRAIEITETGRFTNGKAEVEEAEISGVYEGDLTVRKRLLIRSTGRVQGTVRYGELEIERGGRLSGSVSMLES
jgi:cytoskeletal protein CcmA (bactofilin family)